MGQNGNSVVYFLLMQAYLYFTAGPAVNIQYALGPTYSYICTSLVTPTTLYKMKYSCHASLNQTIS